MPIYCGKSRLRVPFAAPATECSDVRSIALALALDSRKLVVAAQ